MAEEPKYDRGYIGGMIPVTTDAERVEPPPEVFEAAGAKLKVRGAVEGFYLGGAVVAVPNAGGGTTGVATGIKGLKLGDLVTLKAEVVAARAGAVKVRFKEAGAAGYDQEAELSRFRCTFE